MPAAIAPYSPCDAFFGPEHMAQRLIDHSFPVVERARAKNIEVKPWLQKCSQAPSVHYGESPAVLARKDALTDEELEALKTSDGIVALNKDGIELALDRRVSLFFQQAILCHNMPFVFSTQGADDQIGTAKQLQFSSVSGTKLTCKREAAHSSTVPTLLARPKNQAEAPLFVYLKGGTSYFQHNATIGMHVHVNGADELLDGKGDKGLRGAAIKIINRVAEGLDPREATLKFLGKFEKNARRASATLPEEDPRKAVLRIYRQQVAEIAEGLAGNPLMFDRLMGVKINSADPDEEAVRKVVYRARYDLIKLQEVTESEIAFAIDAAKQAMEPREGTFLEYMLLKEFAEGNQRVVIEKLFAKTAAIYEEEYAQSLSKKDQSSFKSFNTRIKKLRQKYPELIDKLAGDLRSYFRHLSSSEFAYRIQVFRGLRTEVKNWTQKQFCAEHRQKTGIRISQASVSRMEQLARIDSKLVYQTPLSQRKKVITLKEAENCAKTFDIDLGLFLPCLVTSSDKA